MKIQNEDQVAALLESALYSAGRPLTVEELIKASGTESRQKTLDVLDSIIKKMKSAFKAIEIVNLPDGSYVFKIKTICIKTTFIQSYTKNIIIYCIRTAYKFKTTFGS